MGTNSAIFIQRGTPAAKQVDACLAYTEGEHWGMRHYVPHWAADDAVRLVRDGVVDVIVAAFDSKQLRDLAADVGAAGRVMFIHPSPTVIEPPPPRLLPGVRALIVRWWRGGRSVQRIAADVEQETGEIRNVLREAGEEPDPLD